MFDILYFKIPLLYLKPFGTYFKTILYLHKRSESVKLYALFGTDMRGNYQMC